MDLLTRRRFLAASGVVGATALAAGASWRPLSELLAAGASTPAGSTPLADGERILVLVTLYGGNDSLGMLVPYADPAYHDARPELAYSADEVLHLDDAVGLNPEMTGAHGLWGKNQLAVVQGVGYPQPDRSHFRSMDVWQSGSPGHPEHTGWIGRWLDATGADPLRAVSVGSVPPPLMAGETCAGAAVPLGPLSVPTGTIGSGVAALSEQSPGEPAMQAAAARGVADLLRLQSALQPVTGIAGEPDDSGPAEDETKAAGASAGGQGALGQQLSIVRRCIEARTPTRVYAVSLGGFDTHADEKGTQSRLLRELDAALTGFLDSVEGRPVVVAVYSEFGRRVEANASQGTDHGTAGTMLIAGSPVRGGLYGEQPSLTKLRDGDLAVTTDFRSVYATLLEDVLGTDAESVLEEAPDRLPLITS